ncbi:hypothetical protein [Fuerstiella marisgermanici]|uniref:Uncharacterized protein n=1 Tax=Fuerstiella marisgermanici TaxID=1891926 RepID=A0A1P8WEG4_9PLAN|nr:hypothetical protein [Fuerstiella marisgermanici]APZ92464.1 hypothetical protein Fuma_02075 [Fuerstiella marisgermanici]
MTKTTTSRLDKLKAALPESPSPQDLIASLQQTLTDQKDFHRLFDAKLLEVRQRMGLPLAQPTSLENVPAEQEQDFRDAYVVAAREVGKLFLEDGQLGDAWAYFRTIGEPEPVKAAIDKISVPREPDEEFDQVMNVALYEGAHIARGLEFLLKTHGTCNTVTAYSQLQQQMTPDERRAAAAMMVRNIYDDLQATIRRDVESRMPVLTPNASIAELISGREWLFAEGNYHIDVSHLHSTVGFARALKQGDPELLLAVELCDYGSKLATQLQYPADVPFDDYYKANRFFLTAIAGEDTDAGIDYFLQRLKDAPDEQDQQLIAFVLLDLAQRVGQTERVLAQTAAFVSKMEDPNGFSFTKLCLELGMADKLEEAAAANDDLLGYTIAKLSQAKA